MSTIFSRIISGELPAHKVAETKDYLAFLDIRPVVRGHTLVIPKNPVDYIFDLKDEEYIGLNLFAKAVAIGLKKTLPCAKVATAVIGIEVPHAHIHLMPFSRMEELNFMGPRLSLTDTELAELAQAIRANM
jgi:histidine triad (HIT) family protein